MMLPCRGRDRGTHTTTRASPPAVFSLMTLSSFWPPSVSLATTRMIFTRWGSYRSRGRLAVCGGAGRGREVRRARGPEDAVHGARDAVLVRSADDRRHLVEVEHWRWGGDLPLERERPPRVRDRPRTAAPRGDHVVEEDQRTQPEDERRDRDEEVPTGELLRVVVDAAGHALHADQVHRGERQVEEDERRPEVQPAERLVVHPPGHL